MSKAREWAKVARRAVVRGEAAPSSPRLRGRTMFGVARVALAAGRADPYLVQFHTTLRPKQALRYARWIIDTFGDEG